MDRAEKIGLGTAVGGHLVLLALLSLGLLLSANNLPSSRGISVSLVGEEADISTAPDATQEDTAPAPSADELSPPDEPPPAPETVTLAKQTSEPVTKSKPVAEQRPVTNKPSKQTIPPRSQPQRPTQTAQQSKPGQGTKPGGFKLDKDVFKGNGRSDESGKAEGQKAAKSDSQVRREVNAAIGPQIQRYIESCAPDGLDVGKIITTVTLTLGQNGSLQSLGSVSQSGINATNSAQAPRLRQCVLDSIRKASPFRGLNADYYDQWKSHRMSFQPN